MNSCELYTAQRETALGRLANSLMCHIAKQVGRSAKTTHSYPGAITDSPAESGAAAVSERAMLRKIVRSAGSARWRSHRAT